MRIAMFVFNDVSFDARVLREAATLQGAGHEVLIVGRLTDRPAGSAPEERLASGVVIRRVAIPPARRRRWTSLRHYPWRLRGDLLATMRAGLRDGPAGWARVGGATAAGLALTPWMAIQGARYVARGGRGSPDPRDRDAFDWLAWWATVISPWAGAAADAALGWVGETPAPRLGAVHGHDLTGLPAAAVTRRRLGGRPRLVYDSHELFLEAATSARQPTWAKRPIARRERGWLRAASALVTVNGGIADALRATYGTIPPVTVVHNCPPRWIPPEPLPDRLRGALGIDPGAPVVLYHGAFQRDRGLPEAAEAMLEPGLGAAHLVYLGFGPLQGRLESLAAEPRYAGRLHVLPAVPPDELAGWVASADVGVMPNQPTSRNEELSTPNKLFECLAAGLPIVTADFPERRRIVLDDPDGPLGAVCDPRRPADIGRAIASILDRGPVERADLRRRCLRAAHARWNWETESARLTALYAELAAGTSDTPADGGPPAGAPPAADPEAGG